MACSFSFLVFHPVSCLSIGAICVPHLLRAVAASAQLAGTTALSGLWPVSQGQKGLVVRQRHGDNLSGQCTECHHQALPQNRQTEQGPHSLWRCWYDQHSTGCLAEHALGDTAHQETGNPTAPVCPDDDELYLFCRRTLHDLGRCCTGDNEALLYQLRGLSLLHKGGQTRGGLGVEGVDEGLWRDL